MRDTSPLDEAPRELKYVGDIVAAYVGSNDVSAEDISDLIRSVYGAIAGLGSVPVGGSPSPKPAVPVRKSVTPGYLICLEDGKKLKMLKRHLRTHYQLTPNQYRARWGLPADYPMTASDYAARRSVLAKKSGLGQRPKKAGARRRT